MANYNRSSLVLSVNKALWGEIGPDLRQVTATIGGSAIVLRFAFTEKASPQDRLMTERVIAMVGKDFPELKAKSEIVESADALGVEEGWNRIYRRRE